MFQERLIYAYITTEKRLATISTKICTELVLFYWFYLTETESWDLLVVKVLQVSY